MHMETTSRKKIPRKPERSKSAVTLPTILELELELKDVPGRENCIHNETETSITSCQGSNLNKGTVSKESKSMEHELAQERLLADEALNVKQNLQNTSTPVVSASENIGQSGVEHEFLSNGDQAHSDQLRFSTADSSSWKSLADFLRIEELVSATVSKQLKRLTSYLDGSQNVDGIVDATGTSLVYQKSDTPEKTWPKNAFDKKTLNSGNKETVKGTFSYVPTRDRMAVLAQKYLSKSPANTGENFGKESKHSRMVATNAVSEVITENDKSSSVPGRSNLSQFVFSGRNCLSDKAELQSAISLAQVDEATSTPGLNVETKKPSSRDQCVGTKVENTSVVHDWKFAETYCSSDKADLQSVASLTRSDKSTSTPGFNAEVEKASTRQSVVTSFENSVVHDRRSTFCIKENATHLRQSAPSAKRNPSPQLCQVEDQIVLVTKPGSDCTPSCYQHDVDSNANILFSAVDGEKPSAQHLNSLCKIKMESHAKESPEERVSYSLPDYQNDVDLNANFIQYSPTTPVNKDQPTRDLKSIFKSPLKMKAKDKAFDLSRESVAVSCSKNCQDPSMPPPTLLLPIPVIPCISSNIKQEPWMVYQALYGDYAMLSKGRTAHPELQGSSQFKSTQDALSETSNGSFAVSDETDIPGNRNIDGNYKTSESTTVPRRSTYHNEYCEGNNRENKKLSNDPGESKIEGGCCADETQIALITGNIAVPRKSLDNKTQSSLSASVTKTGRIAKNQHIIGNTNFIEDSLSHEIARQTPARHEWHVGGTTCFFRTPIMEQSDNCYTGSSSKKFQGTAGQRVEIESVGDNRHHSDRDHVSDSGVFSSRNMRDSIDRDRKDVLRVKANLKKEPKKTLNRVKHQELPEGLYSREKKSSRVDHGCQGVENAPENGLRNILITSSKSKTETKNITDSINGEAEAAANLPQNILSRRHRSLPNLALIGRKSRSESYKKQGQYNKDPVSLYQKQTSNVRRSSVNYTDGNNQTKAEVSRSVSPCQDSTLSCDFTRLKEKSASSTTKKHSTQASVTVDTTLRRGESYLSKSPLSRFSESSRLFPPSPLSPSSSFKPTEESSRSQRPEIPSKSLTSAPMFLDRYNTSLIFDQNYTKEKLKTMASKKKGSPRNKPVVASPHIESLSPAAPLEVRSAEAAPRSTFIFPNTIKRSVSLDDISIKRSAKHNHSSFKSTSEKIRELSSSLESLVDKVSAISRNALTRHKKWLKEDPKFFKSESSTLENFKLRPWRSMDNLSIPQDPDKSPSYVFCKHLETGQKLVVSMRDETEDSSEAGVQHDVRGLGPNGQMFNALRQSPAVPSDKHTSGKHENITPIAVHSQVDWKKDLSGFHDVGVQGDAKVLETSKCVMKTSPQSSKLPSGEVALGRKELETNSHVMKTSSNTRKSPFAEGALENAKKSSALKKNKKKSVNEGSTSGDKSTDKTSAGRKKSDLERSVNEVQMDKPGRNKTLGNSLLRRMSASSVRPVQNTSRNWSESPLERTEQQKIRSTSATHEKRVTPEIVIRSSMTGPSELSGMSESAEWKAEEDAVLGITKRAPQLLMTTSGLSRTYTEGLPVKTTSASGITWISETVSERSKSYGDYGVESALGTFRVPQAQKQKVIVTASESPSAFKTKFDRQNKKVKPKVVGQNEFLGGLDTSSSLDTREQDIVVGMSGIYGTSASGTSEVPVIPVAMGKPKETALPEVLGPLRDSDSSSPSRENWLTRTSGTSGTFKNPRKSKRGTRQDRGANKSGDKTTNVKLYKSSEASLAMNCGVNTENNSRKTSLGDCNSLDEKFSDELERTHREENPGRELKYGLGAQQNDSQDENRLNNRKHYFKSRSDFEPQEKAQTKQTQAANTESSTHTHVRNQNEAMFGTEEIPAVKHNFTDVQNTWITNQNDPRGPEIVISEKSRGDSTAEHAATVSSDDNTRRRRIGVFEAPEGFRTRLFSEDDVRRLKMCFLTVQRHNKSLGLEFALHGGRKEDGIAYKEPNVKRQYVDRRILEELLQIVHDEFAFDGFLNDGVEDVKMAEFIVSHATGSEKDLKEAVRTEYKDLYWKDRVICAMHKVVHSSMESSKEKSFTSETTQKIHQLSTDDDTVSSKTDSQSASSAMAHSVSRSGSERSNSSSEGCVAPLSDQKLDCPEIISFGLNDIGDLKNDLTTIFNDYHRTIGVFLATTVNVLVEKLPVKIREVQQQINLERRLKRRSWKAYSKLTKNHELGAKETKDMNGKLRRDIEEIEWKIAYLRNVKRKLKNIYAERFGLDGYLLQSFIEQFSSVNSALHPYIENNYVTFAPLWNQRHGLPGPDDIYESRQGAELQHGSQTGLLAYLFARHAMTQGYVKQFLYTYRYCMTSDRLLQFIRTKYTASVSLNNINEQTFHQIQIQYRALDLMAEWIEDYFEVDFKHNERLCQELKKFLEHEVVTTDKSDRGNLLLQILAEKREFMTNNDLLPQREVPRHGSLDDLGNIELSEQRSCLDENYNTKMKCDGVGRKSLPCEFSDNEAFLLDYPDQVLAEQLSLIQQDLFHRVHPVHFLNTRCLGVGVSRNSTPNTIASHKDVVLGFSAGSRRGSSDGYELMCSSESNTMHAQELNNEIIEDLIEHAQNLSMWIAGEICGMPSIKSQLALITKLINVANYCHEIRNFETTVQIVDALETFVVRQLPVWKQVTTKTFEILDELKAIKVLLKTDASWLIQGDAYRRKPTIPSALLFIMHVQQHELGGFLLANGMCKWTKLRSIARLVDQIHAFQELKYNFLPNEDLQRSIKRRITNLKDQNLHLIASENSINFHGQRPSSSSKKLKNALEKMKSSFG